MICQRAERSERQSKLLEFYSSTGCSTYRKTGVDGFDEVRGEGLLRVQRVLGDLQRIAHVSARHLGVSRAALARARDAVPVGLGTRRTASG